VGEVLAAYSQSGVLNDTYVIFTSDHGHTPVLKDQIHDLAFGDHGQLDELLEKTGWRVRKPGVKLTPDQGDYQAVIADEGFAAYLYLANRSTCSKAQEPCDWRRPAPFSGRRVTGFTGTVQGQPQGRTGA
jgi:arylsulfatase A-like enzyme